MGKYKRIFTIVVDSMGVGALPDAAEYGDAGQIRWVIFLTTETSCIYQIFRNLELRTSIR